MIVLLQASPVFAQTSSPQVITTAITAACLTQIFKASASVVLIGCLRVSENAVNAPVIFSG